MSIRKRLLAATAICALSAITLRADDVEDLKAEVRLLQEQLRSVQDQLDKLTQQQPPAPAAKPAANAAPRADTAVAGAQPAPGTPASGGGSAVYTGNPRGAETAHFFQRKPGKSLTFYTGAESENGPGELTMYGTFDLSFDYVSKGLGGAVGPDGMPPVGNMGWLPDISTNISYVGVRGFQPLGTSSLNLVYQFETQVDIASTSGVAETNSSESNAVKGALTSRNTFIGISSPVWGSIKFGKTDTPYKMSTMRMDAFYGMIGDYQAIMGNTGGDNRVEFGTRLDHSIWYESPNWGGVALNALFSPGQNRASNSDNLAAGESDCTGGNIPGSGGIYPVNCSDGSFSNAVSTSLTFTKGPVYVAAGYERHMKVNRESDITGYYANCGTTCQMLEAQDVADEDAAKLGARIRLTRWTSLNGIFESMHRYVPQDLEFQNERQRDGSWFGMDQALSRSTSLSVGWAHAFRTPGDPGQHNDSFNTPLGGIPGTDSVGGSHVNNQANLFSAALRYKASNTMGFYLGWGYTANGQYSHYDLGAGGRSVATDCHDASDATGGLVGSDPHCWTGGQLTGASLGMNWKF